MTRHLRTLAAAALLAIAAAAGAAPDAPQWAPAAAVEAEGTGNWDEALAIYRRIVVQDPGRVEVWLHIADIEAARGNTTLHVDALQGAHRAAPGDAAVMQRLVAALSAAQQPDAALPLCLRALELQPGDGALLERCAQLASWAGEAGLAADLYARVLAARPDDPDTLLQYARNAGWAGELDAAARSYRSYLERRPADDDARLEAARVEAWRGNFPLALDLLEAYRSRVGDDERYRADKARVLAWAGRPREAARLNEPLLARHPDDYELRYTQSLILDGDRRPHEALESLAPLLELRPDSPDTALIARQLRASKRSDLSLGYSYYEDSDDIRISRLALHGSYVPGPATRLEAGIEHSALRARRGTGLEAPDGRESIDHQHGWIGARHRFGPGAAADLRLGRGTVEDGGDYDLYRVGLDLNPGDSWDLRLERAQRLFDPSPRAVAREIVETVDTVRATWRPGLPYVVEAQAEWGDLSDTNERRALLLAPRRAVLRRERWNLDLGLSGQWLGYDRNLDNGYYDPSDYRRYAFTAFGYWKISDDDGVSLTASLGWHTDETIDGYELGEDIALAGTFGLYRDWMLRARLSYADRGLEAGGYDGLSAGATLTRRF
jgi:Tfp pilus assembly protein PilF